jgi:phage tail-like protein
MTESTPKLLDYLPAIYQEDPFLQKFLLAFDDILLGSVSEPKFPADGLEQTIAQIPKLFDPKETPKTPETDFLSWLAEWTAFTVRNDLEPSEQRKFIARVIPLYRRRGTMNNLKELLTIFVRGEPTIREPKEFQIGITSQIGETGTFLGGKPHYFEVEINISKGLDRLLRDRQIEIASALIELEKPAHTYYTATFTPLDTIQIGVQSTIGVDTILGKPPNDV